MALASTDLLIVQRAEESYKVPASEVKSFILGSAGGGVPEFVGNAASATKLKKSSMKQKMIHIDKTITYLFSRLTT